MPATAARASWAAVVRESASSAEIALLSTQAFAPLRFVIAAGGGGFGLLQLGFEAAHLGLERAWVDLEQQVAFLHEGAFGEGHLIDLAGHPWTDLHGFRCFQAAGEFVPLVDRLLQHLGHADLCRGHGGRLFRGLAARAHHHHGQNRQGQAQVFECTVP